MTIIPDNMVNKAGAGLRVPRDRDTVTHGRKMGSAKTGHFANMLPHILAHMALHPSTSTTLTLMALQTGWRKRTGHGRNITKTKTKGRCSQPQKDGTLTLKGIPSLSGANAKSGCASIIGKQMALRKGDAGEQITTNSTTRRSASTAQHGGDNSSE